MLHRITYERKLDIQLPKVKMMPLFFLEYRHRMQVFSEKLPIQCDNIQANIRRSTVCNPVQ